MCSKGLAKRLLPFFATFAIGLFIASFFVSVGAPGFRFHGRGWERHQMFERLQIENEQLKNENLRLKNENNHSRFERSIDLQTGEEVDSLMPLEAPHPQPLPGRPLAPRVRR